MEHKITTENILKAAEKCPQAKETLKTMFPEAFEDDRYFDLSKLPEYPFSTAEANSAGFKDSTFLKIRNGGNYALKSFWLDDKYDWEIKRDKSDGLCLIPTRK